MCAIDFVKMKVNFLMAIVIVLCCVAREVWAATDEVFFVHFKEGPELNVAIRSLDGMKFLLKYGRGSNVKAANDLDALDVRIKRANGYGGTNRFVLLGYRDNEVLLVLSDWYIICPFLDDRNRGWDSKALPVWTGMLVDADFSKLIQSPIEPYPELRRDYLIKKGEYCRTLVSVKIDEKQAD